MGSLGQPRRVDWESSTWSRAALLSLSCSQQLGAPLALWGRMKPQQRCRADAPRCTQPPTEQSLALGGGSGFGPGMLYCPAQMSEERIKARAETGRRILCSGDLAQEQSSGRFRHGVRGISRTCLRRPAPVPHHLTHSRRQSLALQPGRPGIYSQQVMPQHCEGHSWLPAACTAFGHPGSLP